MILTFTNTTVANATYVIIVIIPVYTGISTDRHYSQFLTQLLSKDSYSTNVSLGELFADRVSYGYNVCIATGDGTNIKHIIPTYIISVPDGGIIDAPMAASVFTIDYKFYSPFTGGIYYDEFNDNIVTSFSYNDATKTIQPASWSGTAQTIPCQSITTAQKDGPFLSNVLYYTYPPTPSSQGAQSALFTLDQYKCYPFNKLNNIDAQNHVIPMSTIAQGLAASGGSSLSTGGVWAIIGIFIGAIMAIGAFVIIWRSMSTKPDIPPSAFAAMNARVNNNNNANI